MRFVENVQSRSNLVAQSQLNLGEMCKHFAVHVDGFACAQDSLVLVASRCPCSGALRNAAIRLDPTIDAMSFVRQADLFFSAHNRSYTVWSIAGMDTGLPDAAQAFGLVRGTEEEDAIGMAISKPPQGPISVDSTRLIKVKDVADVRLFAEVVGQMFSAFGRPEDAIKTLSNRPSALITNNVTAFVAVMAGQPVACSVLSISEGAVAGIYLVGTVPWARRRGLGELVTRAATDAGFAAGARVVLLQSNLDVVPLYRKIGFREFAHYANYVYRVPNECAGVNSDGGTS
jgi:ribosomal protein S18 acetylase RimI-like enzyme